MRGHFLGVQNLAQGHFGMQIGKTGIEPMTFWLEDDHFTPALIIKKLRAKH